VLNEVVRDDVADLLRVEPPLLHPDVARSTMVEMVAAYVDGRPMPFSSSALIRVASV